VDTGWPVVSLSPSLEVVERLDGGVRQQPSVCYDSFDEARKRRLWALSRWRLRSGTLLQCATVSLGSPSLLLARCSLERNAKKDSPTLLPTRKNDVVRLSFPSLRLLLLHCLLTRHSNSSSHPSTSRPRTRKPFPLISRPSRFRLTSGSFSCPRPLGSKLIRSKYIARRLVPSSTSN
jgi:hypothetical protein